MAFQKMLWQLKPDFGPWDYWTSVPGVFLGFYDDTYDPPELRNEFKKVNGNIAYYGLAIFANNNPRYPDAVYIVMSPDPDAVTLKYIEWGYEYSREYPYNSTVRDKRGITWYVNAFRYYMQIDIEAPDIATKPCYINDWDDPYPNNQTGKDQAIQDMLNKIYADKFTEDYQKNNIYTPNVVDPERYLRRLFGIYLFTSVNGYISGMSDQGKVRYKYISDNADTLIAYMVSKMNGSNDVIANLELIPNGAYYDNYENMIIFYHYQGGVGSETIRVKVTSDKEGWWGGFSAYRYEQSGYFDRGHVLLREHLKTTQDSAAPYALTTQWMTDNEGSTYRLMSSRMGFPQASSSDGSKPFSLGSSNLGVDL